MTKRVLFISGSFGLGHISRDLGIVQELRRLVPDMEVSWLASPPADKVILGAEEKLLPDAADWADESAPAERGRKRVFQAQHLGYLMKSRKGWSSERRSLQESDLAGAPTSLSETRPTKSPWP
jgi:hypothetical protein